MSKRFAIGAAFVAGLLLGAAGALGAAFKWHRQLDRLHSQRIFERLRAEEQAAIATGRARARRADTTRLRASVREVRRVQVEQHCAITFVVDDPRWQNFQLFDARVSFAQRESSSSTIISQAWAYRPAGYRVGDSIEVVMPYTWCAQARVIGYGGLPSGPDRRSTILQPR